MRGVAEQPFLLCTVKDMASQSQLRSCPAAILWLQAVILVQHSAHSWHALSDVRWADTCLSQDAVRAHTHLHSLTPCILHTARPLDLVVKEKEICPQLVRAAVALMEPQCADCCLRLRRSGIANFEQRQKDRVDKCKSCVVAGDHSLQPLGIVLLDHLHPATSLMQHTFKTVFLSFAAPWDVFCTCTGLQPITTDTASCQ